MVGLWSRGEDEKSRKSKTKYKKQIHYGKTKTRDRGI